MAYTDPPTWVNGGPPPRSATNLNKMSQNQREHETRILVLESGPGGGGLTDPLTTDLTLNDDVDLILGTSTGTRIGTATTQKLAFFNATPVVRPTSTTDIRTALINLGLYASGGASPLDLNGGALTSGTHTIVDATNIVVGSTTGTKIGTTTGQKLGFFNATPIAQPSNTTDLRAALINLGLYASGGATPLDLNGGALSANNLLLNNTLGVQIKDSGGTARDMLILGSDNVARVGLQAVTPSNGHLIFYAGGAEAGRFTPTGDFKSTARIGAGLSPTAQLDSVYSGAAHATFAATHTLPNGTGLTNAHEPFKLVSNHVCTDLADPPTTGNLGLSSILFYGGQSTPVLAQGYAHAASFQNYVRGTGGADNEQASIFTCTRDETPAGSTHGRLWIQDNNLHGAIGEQQQLIAGIVCFINNYYNGSPVLSPSVGLAVQTRKGGGGARTVAHEAATTYPMDRGIFVGGQTGATNQNAGFTTGIKVGGAMGPWGATTTGRVIAGIDVSDYETFGLKVSGRTAAATGPAIAVGTGSGPLLVGNTTAVFSSTLLEVQAPASSNADPLATFGHSSDVQAYSFTVRNGAGSIRIGVCASANNFMTGTASGDSVLNQPNSGKRVHMGGSASALSVGADNSVAFRPSAAQTLVAGTAILANAGTIQITAASPITSTAAPTVADGVDGQRIRIVNTGANAITLSDQGALPSSNLRLDTNTVAIGPRQSIELTFLSAVGDWVQTGSRVVVI